MIKYFFITFALILFLLVSTAFGQECAPPPITANNGLRNMFSAEQEMVLGRITLKSMSREIRIIKSADLNAFIDSIGSRIVKNLPQTGLVFTFHIIDYPEANAFNIPGGHVFVSRKMIAFANSEDEIAGVIAHELGHAIVHHAATDMSENMRKILKITAVGDAKDVEEKFNLLIENYRTRRISQERGHEDDQQAEADRLAIIAMTLAGYEPAAFASVFDRLTESEGKTGSWFGDLFGKVRPEQRRLREMIKATEQLPAPCRKLRNGGSIDDFQNWQASVVAFRNTGQQEVLPGIVFKRTLEPKLRADIRNLAFSSDGRYLLAQDDYSITVIKREPLAVLFQIPVEDSSDAFFTPNSKELVFITDDLRYERWNLENRKPVLIKELVVRADCWEHALSPDGNLIGCVDTRGSVNLIDTTTGKKIWEKKETFRLSRTEYFYWWTSSAFLDRDEPHFFRIAFSPDSRNVLFCRSRQHLVGDLFVLQISEPVQSAVALDTKTLKQIDIGDKITELGSRPFLFLDSNRILAMPEKKTEANGLYDFPTGKRIEQFPVWGDEFEPTANPDYVIIKPLKESKLGIFDLKKKAIVSGFDKSDAAVWNQTIAFEAASGKIMLRDISYNESEKKFDYKEVGSIDVPVGPLGRLTAASVADNFGWMIVSTKSRGGVWDLSSGQRKLHVRGFRSGVVADDGIAVSDFEKIENIPHSLVFMNPSENVVKPIREIDRYGARQIGRFVLTRTGLPPSGKVDPSWPKSADLMETAFGAELRLRKDVRWEIKDFVQDKVVWTRDFAGTAPSYSIDPFSGRLIVYWYLGTSEGKAAVKARPELAARAEALGDKTDDYLIEVHDLFTEKQIGALLLETGKNSFDVGEGMSEGDWLMLHDSEGRVLGYSLKTGELVHRFFGNESAMNPARSLVAIQGFPGEISLYDLESGNLKGSVTIGANASFIRFNFAGNRMFVLSETQNAYVFDVDKVISAQTARP